MNQPARGRVGGGRGRGRNTFQVAQGPPVAAQMRQIQRASEPIELGLLRRPGVAALGYFTIRSTYTLAGLVSHEYGRLDQMGAVIFDAASDVETRLAIRAAQELENQRTARVQSRIFPHHARAFVGEYPGLQRLVEMSNAQFSVWLQAHPEYADMMRAHSASTWIDTVNSTNDGLRVLGRSGLDVHIRAIGTGAAGDGSSATGSL